jgi:hypothetical protein
MLRTKRQTHSSVMLTASFTPTSSVVLPGSVFPAKRNPRLSQICVVQAESRLSTPKQIPVEESWDWVSLSGKEC